MKKRCCTALHCMQKGHNIWVGAVVYRLERWKQHRSLFQDIVYLHKKKECFLPLCCFLRCGFIFSLNPFEPTIMSVCSCPFFKSPPAIIGTWQVRPTCWYSWKLICILPLLLPVWLATQLLAPTQGRQCTIISVDAKRRLDCPFQQQLQALRVTYDNKPG